jgi:hypothetical protein
VKVAPKSEVTVGKEDPSIAHLQPRSLLGAQPVVLSSHKIFPPDPLPESSPKRIFWNLLARIRRAFLLFVEYKCRRNLVTTLTSYDAFCSFVDTKRWSYHRRPF